MGFFSRKTKVYVSSMAYQLGETDPNALATNTLLAIYSSTPISEMIKHMTIGGMANKVKLARKYAKETYTLGLPSGNFNTLKAVSDADLATAIATAIDYPLGVVVDFTIIEPLTPFHFVREYLLANRDWDQLTNLIGIFPPCDLPSGPASDEYPTTHTCELTDVVSTADGSEATIIYEVKSYQDAYMLKRIGEGEHGPIYKYGWYTTLFNTQEVTEAFTVPATHILGSEHYIVSYRKIIAEGFDPTVYMWYYAVGDTTYPALTESPDTVDEFSGLPVVPIRYNNKDLTAESEQGTDLYLTSKKLLRKLDLNIDDIAEVINTNESVDEIDHAYIMFGIDVQTEEQNSLTYLVHFFDKLADKASLTQLGTVNAYMTGETPDVRNSYSISNQYADNSVSLVEHGLNIKIAYNWVKSELRIGNIGTIEEPAKAGFVVKELIRQLEDNDYMPSGPASFSKLKEWDRSRLVLKLQITDNIYQYVEVEGLQQTNLIYASKDKAVNTTLTNVIDDPDEHNLIIPVDYNVALNLGTFERNALYEESLQLIMNSVTFIKEKWYETGLFKLVSYIIIAVVTYFAGPYAGAELMAAMASLQAFVQFIVMNIILGAVIKEAFQWLASQLGAEWTAIIAVIVTAITLYFGAGMGKFTIMGNSVGTAQMCLKMSLSMLDAATYEIQNEIDAIGQDYDEFLLTSSEQMEKLQAAQELLIVDPLGEDLLYAQTNRYQAHPLSSDPELFYAMTVHTGNIGTIVFDIIPQYHTVMTTLPDPGEMSFT